MVTCSSRKCKLTLAVTNVCKHPKGHRKISVIDDCIVWVLMMEEFMTIFSKIYASVMNNINYFNLLFSSQGLHSPDWPQTSYVAQVDPELLSIPSLPSHVPPTKVIISHVWCKYVEITSFPSLTPLLYFKI